MHSLLPPNSTELERNVTQVTARLSELPVPHRDLKRPDTCPVELLPWLAQELSVDSWEANWSEQQKRESIKASLGIHRVKGTIGAVTRSLAALGFDVRLQEWFNQIPNGKPYTYRLLMGVTQTGIDKDGFNRVRQIVAATKNMRSHLDRTQLRVVSKAHRRVAAVTGTGHQITLRFEPSPLVINENSLVG